MHVMGLKFVLGPSSGNINACSLLLMFVAKRVFDLVIVHYCWCYSLIRCLVWLLFFFDISLSLI